MQMANINKVKIVVLGDSGVGKTSATHLLCNRVPVGKPSWTVGCSVEVKLHEYAEGTPLQKTYFIELWDIGGSSSHQNARNVFYNGVNGIILVHDLTNRKSFDNLTKWLAEVLNKDSNNCKNKRYDEYDPEQFMGQSQTPVLVIGTKLDLVEGDKSRTIHRDNKVLDEYGADELLIDCLQAKSLAPGNSSSIKITRFFDKVIKNRYYTEKQEAMFSMWSGERKRMYTPVTIS